MADNEKDNPDIYPIRGLAAPPETTITPSNDPDIFAIKKENVDRLGSLIGIVLGSGVFLCNAYRLDKRVSRDETGEIWKASDIQASRNVTVALPPLEIRKDESAIESVRQAAKRLEALDHPRIVPVLDNFTDPEHGFFIVRKFVNGKTLDIYRNEYVKRHGKFSPIRAIKMLNDIAHALDYAHGVDIIHGDLCPKNIIVGLDDEVYLDNFALVPVQADKISAARKPYLSPEVLEGDAATAPSDVYSLAAIAYELLAGRLPYSPETMDTPLPIPHVPSTVDVVIQKAMAILPDDRYDSCGAFIKALETSFREPPKVKSIVVTPPSKPSIKKTFSGALYYSGLLLAFLGVFSLALGCFVYFEDVKSTLLNVVQKWGETPSKPDEIPLETVETLPEPVESAPEPVEPTPEPVEPTPEPVEPTPEPVEPAPEPVKPALEPAPEPVALLSEPKTSNSAQPTTVLTFLNTELYEEGERKTIPFNGVDHDFRWCSTGYFKGGFWIQETTVTQKTWKTIMGPGNMRDQSADGPRLPVRRVSWNECQRFIENLNKMGILAREDLEGYRFALPTEEQWQYAYNKEMLVLHEIGSEWCDEWHDKKGRYRVVRGSGGFRDRRDPEEPLGYTEVSFRLVIVPKEE